MSRVVDKMQVFWPDRVFMVCVVQFTRLEILDFETTSEDEVATQNPKL